LLLRDIVADAVCFGNQKISKLWGNFQALKTTNRIIFDKNNISKIPKILAPKIA